MAATMARATNQASSDPPNERDAVAANAARTAPARGANGTAYQRGPTAMATGISPATESVSMATMVASAVFIAAGS